jgi:hypothetical protein
VTHLQCEAAFKVREKRSREGKLVLCARHGCMLVRRKGKNAWCACAWRIYWTLLFHRYVSDFFHLHYRNVDWYLRDTAYCQLPYALSIQLLRLLVACS